MVLDPKLAIKYRSRFAIALTFTHPLGEISKAITNSSKTSERLTCCITGAQRNKSHSVIPLIVMLHGRGKNLEDLREMAGWMQRAFDKPVIDLEEFTFGKHPFDGTRKSSSTDTEACPSIA